MPFKAARPVLLCESPTTLPGFERIDWFRVINAVLRYSYSIQEISVSRTAFISSRYGAEPAYCDGERLVLLWCQKTGQGRETMPMCS